MTCASPAFKRLILIGHLCLVMNAFAQDQIISEQLCIGGNSEDGANDLLPLTGGGFLLSGYSKSKHGDYTGNHGAEDFAVCRLKPNGDLKWGKVYGGSSSDVAYAATTFLNGYAIVGITASDDKQVTGNHGSNDGWLILINGNGKLVISKCFGGSGSDQFFDMVKTSDGGLLLAGQSASDDGDLTGAAPHGSNEVWLLKLDASANVQWSKCFGGTGADFCRSVIQTTDGNFVAACYSRSADGDFAEHYGPDYNSDVWVIKVDPSGNLLWSTLLGGSDDDYADDLLEDNEGNIWMGGQTNSDDYDIVVKHPGTDVWVVKLTADGTKLHSSCFGGNDADIFEGGLIQLDNNHLLISGSSLSTDVTNSKGGYDVWLANFDIDGNYISDYSYGGSGADFATDIELLPGNQVVLSGRTHSVNGDVTGLHGDFDQWFIRFNSVLKQQWPIEQESDFAAYPVPAGDKIYIRFPAEFEFTESAVRIFSTSGKFFPVQGLMMSDKSIAIASLFPGIYFVFLNDGKYSATIKFVKQ